MGTVTVIPSFRWYERQAEPSAPALSLPDRLPRTPWRPQHPVKVVSRFETRKKSGPSGVRFTAPMRRRW